MFLLFGYKEFCYEHSCTSFCVDSFQFISISIHSILLGHMVTMFNVLRKCRTIFLFPFLHILTNSSCCLFLAILMNVMEYSLVCISLMTDMAELFFFFLLLLVCFLWRTVNLDPLSILFFCFLLLLLFFRATPVAYGGSQARGPIRVTVAGLHHRHSITGSLTH